MGSGDDAKDSGPNKYDGTLTGGKWIEGKFGDAIEFKKGDTVTIPLGKGSMRNKASVIMWLLFTDVSAQQNYFSVWDQRNNRHVPYKDGGNMLRCWSNTWNVPSGVTVKEDKWYHVANVSYKILCTNFKIKSSNSKEFGFFYEVLGII